MRRIALVLTACLLFPSAAFSQAGPNQPNSLPGCEYLSSPFTLTTRQLARLQCDTNGNLRITGTVTATIDTTGLATSAKQDLQITQETAINTVLGTVTASPTANTIGDRLKVINTTLGTPLQAGGAVAAAITAASGSFASGSQNIGITPTDRTVTSATGSSQTVAAALATRKSLVIQNTGNANCGVNPTGGTAVIGGAGTITLAPGGAYYPRVPTLSAITAICTAGQPLYAEES